MTHAAILPTRKWWATQVTAFAGLVAAWISTGAWNQQLSVAAVALLGQAAVGYLVPNLPTPGGVPLASSQPAAGRVGTEPPQDPARKDSVRTP